MASASLSRDGTLSTTTVWDAPSTFAAIAAHSPTGPAPTTATVSPGWMNLRTAS